MSPTFPEMMKWFDRIMGPRPMTVILRCQYCGSAIKGPGKCESCGGTN